MALLFAFNVTVARKTEIDEKYPGGLERFWTDWRRSGGLSYCEDEHLVCFSDMGGIWRLAARLVSERIDVLQSNHGERPEDVLARCRWLDCDFYEVPQVQTYKGRQMSSSYLVRYWLKGTSPGAAICPVKLSDRSQQALMALEQHPPRRPDLTIDVPTN